MLSQQQITFFETFGFLTLPGLFADDIDQIGADFEEVFASTPATEPQDDPDPDTAAFNASFSAQPRVDTYQHLNFGRHRAIISEFLERHDRLRHLPTDPRISEVLSSLLGADYEYVGSDGNLFDCDTSWHCDVYQSPLERYHVKLFFYLDPLEDHNGAIRIIPGTNHFRDAFADTLRRDLADWKRIPDQFGVDSTEIPSWTLTSMPGDVLVGDVPHHPRHLQQRSEAAPVHAQLP